MTLIFMIGADQENHKNQRHLRSISTIPEFRETASREHEPSCYLLLLFIGFTGSKTTVAKGGNVIAMEFFLP